MRQHEISVLIANTLKPSLKVHSDVSSKARGLHFDRSLHLHPIFVYVSISEENIINSCYMLKRTISLCVFNMVDKILHFSCFSSQVMATVTIRLYFIPWYELAAQNIIVYKEPKPCSHPIK